PADGVLPQAHLLSRATEGTKGAKEPLFLLCAFCAFLWLKSRNGFTSLSFSACARGHGLWCAATSWEECRDDVERGGRAGPGRSSRRCGSGDPQDYQQLPTRCGSA